MNCRYSGFTGLSYEGAQQAVGTQKDGSIVKLKREGHEGNGEYGKEVDIKMKYLILSHCVAMILMAQSICPNSVEPLGKLWHQVPGLKASEEATGHYVASLE